MFVKPELLWEPEIPPQPEIRVFSWTKFHTIQTLADLRISAQMLCTNLKFFLWQGSSCWLFWPLNYSKRKKKGWKTLKIELRKRKHALNKTKRQNICCTYICLFLSKNLTCFSGVIIITLGFLLNSIIIWHFLGGQLGKYIQHDAEFRQGKIDPFSEMTIQSAVHDRKEKEKSIALAKLRQGQKGVPQT